MIGTSIWSNYLSYKTHLLKLKIEKDGEAHL